MVQTIVNFETKIISNNRVTIPDDVRLPLKLKEGDYIRFKGELTKVNRVQKTDPNPVEKVEG